MNNGISYEDKILVAGASGLAGSAILKSLRKSGYGKKELGGKLFYPTRNELNYLNYAEVNQWFKKNKPNVVIIAAAKVGGIFANDSFPADFLLENLKIQTNLIEISWQNKVKKLLFLGSNCIYPKFAEQPMIEESLLSGNLEQTNQWYAIAKIAGIKLCESLRRQYGFNAISIMPANLYGPGDNFHPKNSHVLPALVRRFYEAKKNFDKEVICWGTGAPRRDFLHVDDLGDSAVFLLENWSPNSKNAPRNSNGEILTYLNIGSGNDISIKELATLIAEKTGFEGKIIWDESKPDGHPIKSLDIKKISTLGWMPKINLEDGIMSTVNYFRESIEKGSFLRL